MDDLISIFLFLLILLSGLAVILKRPIIGLLLIVMMNPFDQLINGMVDLPGGLTIGRIIGLSVFFGWLLRFLLSRQSHIARMQRFNLISLLIILSMLVSTLLSSYPMLSFQVSLTIIMLITMLLFIQDFIGNKKELNTFIAVIAFSSGVASLIGIIQFLGYKGYVPLIGIVTNYAWEGVRFSGFDPNPNGYAITLMSGIPLLFFMLTESKTRMVRLLSACFLVTSVASLYLTMSRTHFFGLLAFIVVLVLFKFRDRQITRKQILLVGGLIVLFLVIFSKMPSFVSDRLIHDTFSGNDASAEARSDIFLKGLDLIEQNPVFGVGFRAIERIDVSRFHDIRRAAGHDLVSFYFTGTGLVGIFLFCLLCYKTYRYLNAALKKYRVSQDKYMSNLAVVLKAGFISLLATFPGNPIVMQRIFWIYVALAAVLYRQALVGRARLPEQEGHTGKSGYPAVSGVR